MSKAKNKIRTVFLVYIFVFLVWSIYRAVFWLPLWLEEVVIKPLVFLGPVFWALRGSQTKLAQLGFKAKFLPAVRLGLVFGLLYSLISLWFNYLKYGQLELVSFGLSSVDLLVFLGLALVTAVSEEILFRGYILTQLVNHYQDEWLAVGLSGLGFTLIYLPALIFSLEQGGVAVLIQLFLTLLVGWGNSIVYLRTKSIWAPILSHTFWGTAIFLFR